MLINTNKRILKKLMLIVYTACIILTFLHSFKIVSIELLEFYVIHNDIFQQHPTNTIQPTIQKQLYEDITMFLLDEKRSKNMSASVLNPFAVRKNKFFMFLKYIFNRFWNILNDKKFISDKRNPYRCTKNIYIKEGEQIRNL